MEPKWKELLLRVAKILETGDGSYERKAPTPPDVLQEQRSIGPAMRGNLPVNPHALAALPKKRVTKADKIIGALSDLTPVASAEGARQGIHELLAGNKLGGSLALLGAAMDVAPGGEGKAVKAAAREFAMPAKYAILTAENPGGKAATAARNAQHNRSLERALKRAGIQFEKVLGAYTDETTGQALKENSYLLRDIEPDAAEKIGRQFGQNAVITHAGYHNLADGKLHPTRGIVDADGDMYTQLPNGRRILSDIDWEKNNPLASATDSVAARTGRLAAAAIRLPDGSVHEGTSHWAAIEAAQAAGKLPDATHPDFERLLRRATDGFVDDGNKFLTRRQTAARAKQHGISSQWSEDNTRFPIASEEIIEGQGGWAPKIQGDSVAVDWAAKHAPRAEAERVVTAATRTSDGSVFHGPIHHVAQSHAISAGKLPRKPDVWTSEMMPNDYLAKHGAEDGFLTSSGRFVSRDEAERIADAAEQQGGRDALQYRNLGGDFPQGFKAAGDSVAARAPETLTGVAFKHRSGKVRSAQGFDGGHPALWDAVREANPLAMRASYKDGFVTSTGRFVDRDEAMKIARARHQWNGEGRSRIEATELAPKPAEPTAKQPWESPEEYEHRLRTGADVQGDSLATRAVDGFKHVAKEIRAFPEQRRQDMIDALRGEAYMRPAPYGPAVITRDRWKPTERGVFPRDKGRELVRDPKPLEFDVKRKPKATGLHPVAEQIANDPRVVQRILSDVDKGRDMGGIGWYGLDGVREVVEALGGNFRDFNMAGAAGSARTPTHNELTNMSLNLFGKANALSAEESRDEFLRRFPDSMRPTFMGMHRDIFNRGLERGVMGPNKPTDGALKIPHYFHNRMLGGSGVPIDTHETRMLSQATGIPMDEIKAAIAAGGENYMAITEPYSRVAKQLGLTEDQVQASRWLGGGLETGLKSQPKGDFMQTLEDGLLYTARVQGLPNAESPRTLSNLFGRIVRGEDFFMPYSGEGGFPVY